MGTCATKQATSVMSPRTVDLLNEMRPPAKKASLALIFTDPTNKHGAVSGRLANLDDVSLHDPQPDKSTQSDGSKLIRADAGLFLSFLYRKMQSPESLTLLDLRTKNLYDKSHLKFATSLPALSLPVSGVSGVSGPGQTVEMSTIKNLVHQKVVLVYSDREGDADFGRFVEASRLQAEVAIEPKIVLALKDLSLEQFCARYPQAHNASKFQMPGLVELVRAKNSEAGIFGTTLKLVGGASKMMRYTHAVSAVIDLTAKLDTNLFSEDVTVSVCGSQGTESRGKWYCTILETLFTFVKHHSQILVVDGIRGENLAAVTALFLVKFGASPSAAVKHAKTSVGYLPNEVASNDLIDERTMSALTHLAKDDEQNAVNAYPPWKHEG